ncbi:MAG: hypothetical protein RBT11_19855 [Desulfobacterales bacterium]|jgi:hypothetical protein|nr:hypothetical protein [Desulfobacterales bacterium]
MIKHYKIIGYGDIIAKELSETTDEFVVSTPGTLRQIQARDGSIETKLMSIFPPWIDQAAARELNDKFRIDKRNVLFSARADAEATEGHAQFAAMLRQQLSGIQIADAGALNRLRPISGGRR